MDLDLYNDTYDRFLDLIIKINATILEIGCGPGNITKYLLLQNSNIIIKGIDVLENMVDLAKLYNPLAGFDVMDSPRIDSLKVKFDAIVCGFGIPFISQSDCSKLITDCSNLLNESGILYISFVEGDNNNS
jgi:2-polyprenyl-3-methyl-5-hydroxy-6-metoxy-1,4-benzoquinol methylase